MCVRESTGGGGDGGKEEMHQAEQWDLCVWDWGGGPGTMGDQELEFSRMLDCMSEQRSVVHFPRRLLCQLFPCWCWNVFNCLNLNIWAQNMQDGAQCRG